ncbi:unnamed protein product [Peniophora sp. CBMAI 1063]|nr:unnamed protein product [Peniophora sp. CBMAI 1063]
METSPRAPELGLAALPSYGDELHDETAHLGPLPISLLAIQAATTALQYEDHHLLDDPRSEDRLRLLSAVLTTFIDGFYAQQPVESYPAEEQGLFTPQNRVAPLPGSPGPSNPLMPRDDAPFIGSGSAVVAPQPLLTQVGNITPSEASDHTATDARSAQETTVSQDAGQEEDDNVTRNSPSARSLHSMRSEMTSELAPQDASHAGSAAPSGSGAAQPGASGLARTSAPFHTVQDRDIVSNHPNESREASGPSTTVIRLMPQTEAGKTALAYLSEHCDIPEDRQDLENALIHVARHFVIHGRPDREENLGQAQSSESAGTESVVHAPAERMTLKEARTPRNMHDGKPASRGGQLLPKRVRSVFRSIRGGLHVERV